MIFIKKLINKLGLNNGHSRSIKAKKNIVASIGIKGLNILLNFFYVPILLDYLGQDEYGVWLTISSVVTWFGFFDIGLGNGLRNKLGIALAKSDFNLGKKYVSTTYAILAIIGTSLILVSSVAAGFIDWNSVFNTHTLGREDLLIVVLIVFIAFYIRFVLQLIGTVLLADQRPALNNMMNLMTNIITLLIILIIMRFTSGTLVEFSAILSGVPLIVFLISSLILYSSKYIHIAPSIRHVDFSLSGDLLGLGIKFFVIQMTDIIIYTSTNFLISTFTNPGEVVVYNITYKLFSTTTMLYTIVLTPMWSAITEAYALGDLEWIKRSIQKIQKFGLILSVGVIFVLILSPYIYHLWIGDRVKIPFNISLIVAITTILRLLLSVFVAFQNGIGKIRFVMYISLFQALVYIPLAYLLGFMAGMGIIGIILAGILVEIPMRIQQVTLYYRTINRQPTGKWLQ